MNEALPPRPNQEPQQSSPEPTGANRGSNQDLQRENGVDPHAHRDFHKTRPSTPVPLPSSVRVPAAGSTCLSAITTPPEVYHNSSLYPKCPDDSDEEEVSPFVSLYPRLKEELVPTEGIDSLERRLADKITNGAPRGKVNEVSDGAIVASSSETGRSLYRDITNGSASSHPLSSVTDGNEVLAVPVGIPVPSSTLETGTSDSVQEPGGTSSSDGKKTMAGSMSSCTGFGTNTSSAPAPGRHNEGAETESSTHSERMSDPLQSGSSEIILATANAIFNAESIQVAQEWRIHPRKRTTSLAGLICFLMIVIVGVAAVVTIVSVVPKGEEVVTQATSPIHRSQEARDEIVSALSNAFDVTKSAPKSSSWDKAMEWILDDDPLQISVNADNLVQRFFLAYFYFTTTEGQLWSACNPPQTSITNSSSSMDSLCYHQHINGKGLYDRQVVQYYLYLWLPVNNMLASRWLTGQHECQWAGIFCNEDEYIEAIHLDNLNLTGTLPMGFSVLRNLGTLSLAFNNLHGSLPESLADLPNLWFLDLNENHFSGTVPESWWRSNHMQKSLRTINLSYNPLSPWSLPSNIGDMSVLENMLLDATGVTGTFPLELHKLTQMQWLTIRQNSISGTLATEVGLLSNLHMLSVGFNLLTGMLPSEVGKLSGVREFEIWGNLISGSIPEELYSENHSLWALIFSNCQLSGTISTGIAQLSTLGYVLLARNTGLTGTIPTEIGLLTDLKKITLHGTGLRGTIPSELCDVRGDNFLSRVKADCEELSNGTTPMVCPAGCFSSCCNAETGRCTKTGF